MVKKAPTLRERDIERTCSEILAWDGWRRVVTDPKHLRGLGVTEKGIPDGLYIRYMHPVGGCVTWGADVMWIEWKRPKGVISGLQAAWHNAERGRGALTLIAGRDFPASIEGFRDWYAKSGLQRKT